MEDFEITLKTYRKIRSELNNDLMEIDKEIVSGGDDLGFLCMRKDIAKLSIEILDAALYKHLLKKMEC